jgi:hypothetical protein
MGYASRARQQVGSGTVAKFTINLKPRGVELKGDPVALRALLALLATGEKCVKSARIDARETTPEEVDATWRDMVSAAHQYWDNQAKSRLVQPAFSDDPRRFLGMKLRVSEGPF